MAATPATYGAIYLGQVYYGQPFPALQHLAGHAQLERKATTVLTILRKDVGS